MTTIRRILRDDVGYEATLRRDGLLVEVMWREGERPRQGACQGMVVRLTQEETDMLVEAMGRC